MPLKYIKIIIFSYSLSSERTKAGYSKIFSNFHILKHIRVNIVVNNTRLAIMCMYRLISTTIFKITTYIYKDENRANLS